MNRLCIFIDRKFSPDLFPDDVSSPTLSVSSGIDEDDPLIWLSKLNLFHRDREILVSTQWINDAIIFAAQSLLASETKGKIFGFQSTQLSKKGATFKPVPPGAFIQILHIAQCHWAVVSNIDVKAVGGSHNDVVGIYDSGSSSKVTTEVKETICSFFKCSSDDLYFDLINVEKQKNSHDCGVFAVAMATELALGGDPATCRWDAKNMRKHLKNCLEEGKMRRFPTLGQRRVAFGARVKESSSVEVHCIASCRLPNDPDRGMISCDQCKKWFHIDCVKLKRKKSFSFSWKCSNCQNLFEKL